MYVRGRIELSVGRGYNVLMVPSRFVAFALFAASVFVPSCLSATVDTGIYWGLSHWHPSAPSRLGFYTEPGERVGVTVEVNNRSEQPVADVEIMATIPPGTQFEEGSAAPFPSFSQCRNPVVAATTVTCTITSAASFQPMGFSFVVRIPPETPIGTTFRTTGAVTRSTPSDEMTGHVYYDEVLIWSIAAIPTLSRPVMFGLVASIAVILLRTIRS
jgi:uncharacterized repeat protein (TIGR01451 family)